MKRSKKNVRFSKKAMEMINVNAGAVDVASEEMWCCVPEWAVEEHVKKFGTSSSELKKIVHFFKKYEVNTVAMESTGIYWIPLYLALIESGIEVFLVNARFIKNVAGRPKTDRQDSKWIWRLHTYGLLRSSFLPDSDTFHLRAFTRHRGNLIQSQATENQHMQKALFQMNLNLGKVITDITGRTGLDIIKAIVAGEHDPVKLAQLKDPRIKSSHEEIAEALNGQYRVELIYVLKQSLECFEFYQEKIKELDKEIEQFLEKRTKIRDSNHTPPPSLKGGRKLKKRHNHPNFDIVRLGFELYGVDINNVTGIGPSLILTILAEAGTDLMCWPSSKHFTSWLGLSPAPDVSGGKILKNKTKKVQNRLSRAFQIAARSLKQSDTYLGAYYRKMKSKKGAPKAITATARKLAVIVYNMITKQEEFHELGQDYYDQKRSEQFFKYINRKAKSFGYSLVKEEPKQA